MARGRAHPLPPAIPTPRQCAGVAHAAVYSSTLPDEGWTGCSLIQLLPAHTSTATGATVCTRPVPITHQLAETQLSLGTSVYADPVSWARTRTASPRSIGRVRVSRVGQLLADGHAELRSGAGELSDLERPAFGRLAGNFAPLSPRRRRGGS